VAGLPVVRAVPVIPRDIVDEKVTGWVVLGLDIDEFGRVENAQVASSTASRLEEPAIAAARRFRYQRALQNSRSVAMKDVSATVFYWQLAESTTD
jgi:protein TonB